MTMLSLPSRIQIALLLIALLFRLGRARDLRDVTDLSYIKKWAAIGESYAAGLGAGDRIAYFCSRYSGGYPELVNQDLSLGDPANRVFTNLACSGAKIPAIVKQADALSVDQQLITISAGGNDVGLAKILDACVFTFSSVFAENCTVALSKGFAIVDGAEFNNNLDNLIAAAATKLSLTLQGKIYYTGYPRFFDEETAQCDNVSWQIFISSTGKKQYLTKHRRRRMNSLVDAVNGKLEAAVARAAAAGKLISFIRYDTDYAEIQGLYCEPGVDESKPAAAQRIGLLFHEFSTKDPSWGKAQFTPSIAQKHQEQNKTPPADYGNPDFYEDRATMFDSAIKTSMADDPGLKLDPGIVGQDIVDYYHNRTVKRSRIPIAPDSLTKVFHPQQAGHSLIANLVLYNLLSDLVVGQSFPGPTREIQSTPFCGHVEVSEPLAPQTVFPFALNPPEGYKFMFLENSFLDPLFTGCTSSIHPLQSTVLDSAADYLTMCANFCNSVVGCLAFYVYTFPSPPYVNCQAFFTYPTDSFVCGSKNGDPPNKGAGLVKS